MNLTNNYSWRRISAFILDMFFITLLTTLICNCSYTNPKMNDYTSAQSEYSEVYQNAISNFTSADPVETYNFANTIAPAYVSVKKASIYNYIWYLIFFFLYFVIFTYFVGGASLGKKLFNLKIVNEDGSKVTLVNLILRSIIYGSTLFSGITLFMIIDNICLYYLPNLKYLYISVAITSLSVIVEIIMLIMLIKNKDHRSLDDLIGRTKVIDTK
ncbi:MAG TPA: RDD family protein [Bacilli bacterium]|nr:RDD family protein [Bacilli bacterium]HQC84090.1 RDD family protein [Bacilli bacterium]